MSETREISTQVASRLPMPKSVQESFGIKPESWKVLTEAIFPSARTPEAVILALAYCKSRNLDIFKRPVHVVPIWDSKRKCEVETIWPGIGELRTTASRSGGYAGNSDAAFGPTITKTFSGDKGSASVTFPEWCQLKVFRIVQGQKCEFIGPRVYWLESYATYGGSDVPNSMWQTRPIGQLEKCAEAAALRRAYPEELGNEISAEEVGGRRGADYIKDAKTGAQVDDTPLEMPRRKTVDAVKVEEPTKQEPAKQEPARTTIRTQIQTVTVVKGNDGKDGKKKTNDRYRFVIGEDDAIFTFSKTAAELAKQVKVDGGTGEVLEITWWDTEYGKTTDKENVRRASDVDAPKEPGEDGPGE